MKDENSVPIPVPKQAIEEDPGKKDLTPGEEETQTKSLPQKKKIALGVVLVGLLVAIIALILVTTEAGDDKQLENDFNGCEDLSEAQKENIRNIISQAIEVSVDDNVLGIALDNIYLSCLPSGALSQFEVEQDLSNLTEVEISITGCNIAEIESGALNLGNSIVLPSINRISFGLSRNLLTFLPNDLFTEFQFAEVAIDLSDNLFEAFPNEEFLFNVTVLTALNLDGNLILELPQVVAFTSNNTFELSCNDCSHLEVVAENFCSTNANTILKLGDTPLAQAGAELLLEFTGCVVENVPANLEVFVDRVFTNCEDLTAEDRVLLRARLSENTKQRFEKNRFSITDIQQNLGCLPNDALSFVKFKQITARLRAFTIDLSNAGIFDIEEHAFRLHGQEFLRERTRVVINLSENILTFVPNDVFQPFSAQSFVDLNLSNNDFTQLENSEDLLDNIQIVRLDLSGNDFDTLPLIPNIEPSTFKKPTIFISCNECLQLGEIEENYCEDDLFNGEVILSLILTPIAEIGANAIANITGCSENNIIVQKEIP